MKKITLSVNIIILVLFLLAPGRCLTQSEQISGLLIQMLYANNKNTSNETQLNTVIIYQNSTINKQFIMDQNIVDCRNTNIFVLNQSQTNSNFTLTFSNYSQSFQVQLQMGYTNPSVLKSLNCSTPACLLQIQTNCTNSYNNNLITGNIYSSESLILQFKYYIVCSYHRFQSIYQIQWGLVFIAIISISMIYICAKYQQAPSINNFTLYVNYIVVVIYSVLCLTKFLLIYYEVNNIVLAIYIICLVGSVIFGIASVTLCFGEVCYANKIEVFKLEVQLMGLRLRLRIMDGVGFVLGIGLLCLWYFLYTNWIVSDVIYVMIYFSMIKIIKFGSLKIAILIFVINLTIDCAFYSTMDSINSTYQNAKFYFYNNPLFLITPNLTHIPNRKCTWYFVLSMSFAGLLCAYLERFDKNKSSHIYCPTFIVCYSIGAALWLLLSLFVPISLPYDLFTVPGAIVLLVIFANRRGQLANLWEGDFYDYQRDLLTKQKQLIQQLKSINRDSPMDPTLFQNLKLGYKSVDGSKMQSQSPNQKSLPFNLNASNQLKCVTDISKQGNNNEDKSQVPRSAVSRSQIPKKNTYPQLNK